MCLGELVASIPSRQIGLTPALMDRLLKIILNEWLKAYALLMSGYSLNNISVLIFCDSLHFSET